MLKLAFAALAVTLTISSAIAQARLTDSEMSALNGQVDQIRRNEKLKDYTVSIVPSAGKGATTNGCVPKEGGGYCCGSEAVCGKGATR